MPAGMANTVITWAATWAMTSVQPAPGHLFKVPSFGPGP
jgi:hypothetical protein